MEFLIKKSIICLSNSIHGHIIASQRILISFVVFLQKAIMLCDSKKKAALSLKFERIQVRIGELDSNWFDRGRIKIEKLIFFEIWCIIYQRILSNRIPSNQIINSNKIHSFAPFHNLHFVFALSLNLPLHFHECQRQYLKKTFLYSCDHPDFFITEQLSINFIFRVQHIHMYTRFDSYYYSRPVSYRSYNTAVSRPDILTINDQETNELLDFFRRNNVEVENFGGLARGIRFGDLLVERRIFNHNSSAYYATTDFVIRQWKSTNDLSNYHPTGTHIVVKTFPELINKLQKVLHDQSNNLK